MTVRITETRYGRQLYLDTDVYFAPLLEHCGEYNEGEVELFRQFVKPGDMVVDAGAHIGCHTLALSQLVGPAGRVFAFEPQQLLYYALCGSAALSGLFNLWPCQIALGSTSGRARLSDCDYSQLNNFGGVAAVGDAAGGIVVASLDSVFEVTDPVAGISFIKIDVEGSECEVLQGAKETIARCRPVLYVENDRQENSERLIGLMQDMGYRLYSHTPPLFNPNNWKGHKEPIFPGIVSIMIVGVPREVRFETDLPPIRV